MLVDKKYIVFETGVQVRLQTELNNDRIVVTVDMGINPVKPFEQLPGERGERLGKRHTCIVSVGASTDPRQRNPSERTDFARKHLLVVDVALDPSHEMFNVFRRRHLCRLLKFVGVLPEILEPGAFG